MHACMRVCVCVCSVCVCVCVCLCVCVCVQVHACVCEHVYVCVHVTVPPGVFSHRNSGHLPSEGLLQHSCSTHQCFYKLFLLLTVHTKNAYYSRIPLQSLRLIRFLSTLSTHANSCCSVNTECTCPHPLLWKAPVIATVLDTLCLLGLRGSNEGGIY